MQTTFELCVEAYLA